MNKSSLHVFLSYARDDDEPFVERLYQDLTALGFDVWWDRETMEARGHTFLQVLRDAIAQTDRLLLIVGPKAVTSDYVAAEWQFALSICKPVTTILRLGDFDLLPEPLRTAHCFDLRTNDPTKLDNLVEELRQPPAPLGPLHGVPSLPPHHLQRRADLQAVADLVLTDINQPTVITSARQTVTLQGMGGIGKSVVAAAFARACETRRAFGDGIIWLTVGQRPRLRDLMAGVGRALGDTPRNYEDDHSATQALQALMETRACLIVLDDVWEPAHAQPFRDAIAQTRNRLLITTRRSQVGLTLAAQEHQIGLLSPAQAQTFLCDWTGADDPELATIAARLDYLPLALKLAGARMRAGLAPADWLVSFDRVSRMKLSRKSKERDDNLEASIELSVGAVFEDEDERLLYHTFGIFPEDVPVPQHTVSLLWRQVMPELDEFECQEIIDELVDMALVSRDEAGLTLHDLLHSYTREKLGERAAPTHADLLTAYNPDGAPWHQVHHDGYLYYWLATHMIGAGQFGALCDLLTGSRDWMDAKFAACVGHASYVADLELAMAHFQKPIEADQLPLFFGLHAARQVVNWQVGTYSDVNLETLTLLGRKAEALAHARLRDEVHERLSGLISIYTAAATTADAALREEILAEANELVDRRPDERTRRTLVDLLAREGDFETALEVARGLTPDTNGETALLLCRLLSDMSGDARQIQAYRHFRDAFQTIRQVLTWIKVVDAFTDAMLASDFSEGRAFLREAALVARMNANISDMAVCGATCMARVGMIGDAERLAITLKDGGQKAKALGAIARHVTDPEHVERLVDQILAIPPPPSNSPNAVFIPLQAAQVRFSHGDDAEAKELLAVAYQIVENELPSSNIYYTYDRVAKTLLACGQPDLAWEAARRVATEDDDKFKIHKKILNLLSVAQAFHAANEPGKVEAVLDEVRPLLASTDLHSSSGSISQDVFAALIQIGRITECHPLAERLSEYSVGSAIVPTLEGVQHREDLEPALTLARLIPSNRPERGAAVGLVARAMARVGHPQAASILSEALEATRGARPTDQGFQKVVDCMFECVQTGAALALMAGMRSVRDMKRLAELTLTDHECEIALHSAETVSLGDQARGALLRTVADNITDCERLDQVITIARSITDDAQAVATMAHLAHILDVAGDDRADTLFDEAIQRALHSDPKRRTVPLQHVAANMAKTRPLPESLADELLKESRSSGALVGTLSSLVHRGAVDEALALAERSEVGWHRGNAMYRIVEALAGPRYSFWRQTASQRDRQADDQRDGHPDKALAVARNMEQRIIGAHTTYTKSSWRDGALCSVVEALLYQDRVDDAVAVAREIDGLYYYRVDALGSIIFKLLPDDPRLTDLLHEMMAASQRSIERGESSGSYNRGRALAEVAKALADLGRLDEALEIAYAIGAPIDDDTPIPPGVNDLHEQGPALHHIVMRMLAAGDARAEEVKQHTLVSLRRAPSHGSHRLQQFMVDLLRVGDLDNAQRAFDQEDWPANHPETDKAIPAFVAGLARHGDLSRALRFAQRSDAKKRELYLEKAATQLADEDQIDAALTLVEHLSGDYRRRAAGKIAVALARAGRGDEALDFAALEEAPSATFSAIGESLAAVGDDRYEAALDRALLLRSDKRQRCTVATVFANQGRYGRALGAMESQDVSGFVGTLMDWRENLDAMEPGLFMRVWQAVLGVLAWDDPIWGLVAEALEDDLRASGE